MKNPTDKEILDWLQTQLDEERYTGEIIYRISKNRGIRLHESSGDHGFVDVRECLIAAMQENDDWPSPD